jgi:16S rRNA (guanine966-N2)-methyltransferase
MMPRNQPGRLRIIGGQWRSRVLPVIDQPGLRPTPDRVRETLFNWLQGDIAGARCLDLFAGSGALGFEAASRGAAQVVLVENQPAACQLLQDNISTLGAGQIQLVRQEALRWLAQCRQAFDVVFLDPPYGSGLLGETCALLERQHCLAAEALIYLELASEQGLPELPANWQIIRGKKAGQVGYHLIKRQAVG